jgi:hypothetical protein
MAYAILRTAKLKTMGAIAGSLSHTYRERDTPNADPSRSANNTHSHADKTVALATIQGRLPEKRRSNAVLVIEYFIGASPEFFQDSSGDSYFQDAMTWLQERHGRENVVATSIHRDETSPHLVAYVVPLDEAGKLNARKYLGGKSTLSQMQTDFAERVGRQYGLQRGVKGSSAQHTTIKAYYGALEAGDKSHPQLEVPLTPQVTKKGILGSRLGEKRETPHETTHRVEKAVRESYEPVVREAATARLQARRAKEMSLTAQRMHVSLETLKGRLKVLEEAFRGLTSEQISTLVRLIERWKQKNSELQSRNTSNPEKGQERER